MSFIELLLKFAEQLKKQNWTCEYHGLNYAAGKPVIAHDKSVATIKWSFKMDNTPRVFELGEHIVGGGDWIEIDGKRHDADHKIATRFKMGLPPTTKVIIKSEYDIDGKPGYEDVIKFSAKIPMKFS